MRLARNLLLAVTAAIAAMAFMAASASAQSVEIHDEANTHCGAVTMTAGHVIGGGCKVHATSEDPAQTIAHSGATETVTSNCANEFSANINEDGAGYIAVTDASITTAPPACSITPCDEASVGGAPDPELEWPVSIGEAGPTSGEVMIVTFCIRVFNTAEGSTGAFCTIPVDILQVGHQQEFTAFDEECAENAASELTGHWLSEAVPNAGAGEVAVEIEHLI